MQAKNLIVGQSFQIPSCSATLRNLICLRNSKTSVYAVGEERKGKDEPWKTVHDYLSHGTNVEVDESKELAQVERNGGGKLCIVGDTSQQEKPTSKAAGEHRGRGRKASEITWPKGKFQIPNLAKELGVSTTNLYLKLVAMEKVGDARSKELPRKAGQRGKPSREWQVIK